MERTDLEKLLEQVTPGEWIGNNMVHADGERPMTAEEIGEYVCNSVKMGDSTRFLFVSGKHTDGVDCDICHTGNGPRGPANTALIAMAPELARKVIAAEKLVDALREALDNDDDHWALCSAALAEWYRRTNPIDTAKKLRDT